MKYEEIEVTTPANISVVGFPMHERNFNLETLTVKALSKEELSRAS
jgi:hypothetical protein